MKNYGQILFSHNKQLQNCREHSATVQWMVSWQTLLLPEAKASSAGMLSNTTTDRPFLIAGESGTDGELAVCTLREVFNRPPEAPASANCAATLPPPPDNPWFVRLVDWPPSSRIQPRSGGSQSVNGGTSLFEENDEFAEKFHSTPQLGLESDDAQPQSEPRVALWMHSGSSTLRAATIDGKADGKAGQKTLKIEPEKIETAEEADELNLPGRQQLPESERIPLDTACPLLVWTLWTNPLSCLLSR